MSDNEWFPEIESDLVLFYEVYGIEKDDVKDTFVQAVTSHNVAYALASTSPFKKEYIDIDKVKHIITPHYPTYEISVKLPKGDTLKGKRLV